MSSSPQTTTSGIQRTRTTRTVYRRRGCGRVACEIRGSAQAWRSRACACSQTAAFGGPRRVAAISSEPRSFRCAPWRGPATWRPTPSVAAGDRARPDESRDYRSIESVKIRNSTVCTVPKTVPVATESGTISANASQLDRMTEGIGSLKLRSVSCVFAWRPVPAAKPRSPVQIRAAPPTLQSDSVVTRSR